jgi:acetyl-CoA synthetase
LNSKAWYWYNDIVGNSKCKVVDTWWQTETGGHCISPTPCGINDEIRPAMSMRPFFGIVPALLNEKGVEVPTAHSGILCFKKPWPGIARSVYGDHKRFHDTYLNPYPGIL